MSRKKHEFSDWSFEVEAGASSRIPVEDTILFWVGRAVIAFSQLEKQAFDCLSKLQDGQVSANQRGNSKELAVGLRQAADAQEHQSLAKLADWFGNLTNVRNDLLHATPVTAGGRQLLQRNGLWDEERLERTADSFATCCSLMNGWYWHGET